MKIRFFVAAVLLTAVLAFAGCQKNSSTPTPAPIPATVRIDSSYNLTTSGVTIDFKVLPNDSKISQSGVAYSTDKIIGNATKVVADTKKGMVTLVLNGLNPNTKYNIWAYITTADGTIYTKSIPIWTYGLMDIDGNGYHTVKIAGKIFTVENLRVTHYCNGAEIINIADDTTWHSAIVGAMCWYDNNKAKYDSVYGALYNWYAVNDPRGLAPKGWHVPSSNEWLEIRKTLGDDYHIGGDFKETGTKHWKAPNTGATNATGFTALPAGDRGIDTADKYNFIDLGESAIFWNSDAFLVGKSAMATSFEYKSNYIWMSNAFNEKSGFSVRLIKN